jgi:uncharacterized protein YuzE
MKTTQYFDYTRKRPDRAQIKEDWIKTVIEKPAKSEIQSDGRIRKWAKIEEVGKYLRVIMLDDGETVHNAFFDRSFKEKWHMRMKYFSDTDTAHIEFTDKEVHETKEISENIYIDIDIKGNIVSMTIEHAKDNAGLWEFSYQEMSRQTA